MRTAFRGMILALAVLLMAAVPATAADSHELWSMFQGPTVGFNDDPDAVAARCPDGFQWIIQNAGDGWVQTPFYTGSVSFENEHCSAWLAFNPGRATGRIGSGMHTFTTPDGDVLTLAYHGGFRFAGDLDVGVWQSNVELIYTVVNGTGVFAGASGHGLIGAVDNSGFGSGYVLGTLY